MATEGWYEIRFTCSILIDIERLSELRPTIIIEVIG